MTDELLELIKNSKSDEDCIEILKAHEKDLTEEDKRKIFCVAKGISEGELSEEDLNCIVGGSIWSSIWNFIKGAGKTIGGAVTTFAGGIVSVFSSSAGKKVLKTGLNLISDGAKDGSDLIKKIF